MDFVKQNHCWAVFIAGKKVGVISEREARREFNLIASAARPGEIFTARTTSVYKRETPEWVGKIASASLVIPTIIDNESVLYEGNLIKKVEDGFTVNGYKIKDRPLAFAEMLSREWVKVAIAKFGPPEYVENNTLFYSDDFSVGHSHSRGGLVIRENDRVSIKEIYDDYRDQSSGY